MWLLEHGNLPMALIAAHAVRAVLFLSGRARRAGRWRPLCSGSREPGAWGGVHPRAQGSEL